MDAAVLIKVAGSSRSHRMEPMNTARWSWGEGPEPHQSSKPSLAPVPSPSCVFPFPRSSSPEVLDHVEGGRSDDQEIYLHSSHELSSMLGWDFTVTLTRSPMLFTLTLWFTKMDFSGVVSVVCSLLSEK